MRASLLETIQWLVQAAWWMSRLYYITVFQIYPYIFVLLATRLREHEQSKFAHHFKHNNK